MTLSTRHVFISALFAWVIAGCACSRSKGKSQTAPPLKVAAASDLAFAFTEMGAAFEQKTSVPVTFSFGSTGLFSKQIIAGAPFDIFASANVSFVDEVIEKGAADPSTKALYARGRIALYARSDADLPGRLDDLRDARFKRIALANPEHAPYGRAAKQAFSRIGLLAAVKPRLVFADNVQQAMQFVDTGNAEIAVTALSLAMKAKGHHRLLEEELHEAIDQALVVLTRARDPRRAREFVIFVNSPKGREIMHRHGFLIPGEAAAREP